MPEPTSSRSLEDVLASIRKSLAEETVDGLVELSAAAVDAARAERVRTQPLTGAEVLAMANRNGATSAADVLAEDLLRDKLAGALSVTEETGEADDVAALLAEPKTLRPLSNRQNGVHAASPDSGAPVNGWSLRPGLQDAVTEVRVDGAPHLELDPYDRNSSAPASAANDALFDISPRDLIAGMQEKAKPTPAAMPSPTDTLARPRLDPANIQLLNKLRASNAAAIENIAKSNAEAEAEPADVPVDATGPEAEPAASDEMQAEADAEPGADLPDASPDPVTIDEPALDDVLAASEMETRPLVSLPERSAPLFGGQADNRLATVTSGVDHLLPAASATMLLQPDEAVDGQTPPLAGPVAADLAKDEGATTAARALADATPEPTAAADIPPATEAAETTVAGQNKALEDMIAAVLEPVLQKLIETSIGPTLEALVRREVERAMKADRTAE